MTVVIVNSVSVSVRQYLSGFEVVKVGEFLQTREVWCIVEDQELAECCQTPLSDTPINEFVTGECKPRMQVL